MIHDPQHTLTALDILPPLGLRLSFADGATLSVDLAPTIRTHRALGTLADPALFATARLDSRGGCHRHLAAHAELLPCGLEANPQDRVARLPGVGRRA